MLFTRSFLETKSCWWLFCEPLIDYIKFFLFINRRKLDSLFSHIYGLLFWLRKELKATQFYWFWRLIKLFEFGSSQIISPIFFSWESRTFNFLGIFYLHSHLIFLITVVSKDCITDFKSIFLLFIQIFEVWFIIRRAIELSIFKDSLFKLCKVFFSDLF